MADLKNALKYAAAFAFIEGLGGDSTSQGVVQMYDESRKDPRVQCTKWSWYDWAEAADHLAAYSKQGTPVAICCYSNGASFGPAAAARMAQQGATLDFLGGIDPTFWLWPQGIPGNVLKAVCLWNANPLSSFPPVGHAYYALAAGNKKTQLTTYRIMDAHLQADRNRANQIKILTPMRALVRA